MIRAVDSRHLFACFLLAAGLAGPAHAAEGAGGAAPAAASTPAPVAVSLSSLIQVERTEKASDGSEKTVLKNPKDVIIVPGDRLLFTLQYRNDNDQPATGFRATNPLPAAVRFASAGQDWAELSVDGGRNFGKLADLKVDVTGPDGVKVSRAAEPADVTHVRWIFADAIAPRASGTISFRGVVK